MPAERWELVIDAGDRSADAHADGLAGTLGVATSSARAAAKTECAGELLEDRRSLGVQARRSLVVVVLLGFLDLDGQDP